MQQANDSGQPARRERQREKRVKSLNSVVYKPVDRELDRKRLEQQEHSREMRRLDAIERNHHQQ